MNIRSSSPEEVLAEGDGGSDGGGDGCCGTAGFRRLGIDLAVALGSLLTTLNDGLSLLLYFGIAAFFL